MTSAWLIRGQMAKLARKSSFANAFSVAAAFSIVEAGKITCFLVAELPSPAGMAQTEPGGLKLSVDAFFIKLVQRAVCAVNAKRTVASSVDELAASAEVVSACQEDQKS